MWCGVLVQQPSSHNPSKPPANAPARVEICPPALQRARLGWRQRLLDWLAGSWPHGDDGDDDDQDVTAAGATPLDSVRDEFVHALDDIPTTQALDLALRLGSARSLRALWHLRTEVFNVVSCHAGQGEATARLQRLNRHFPARAPRSGFGGFDAEPHLGTLR
ncbi:hypothetical protein [Piscinibacter sp. XHJ-5]|uniref:hypothetical protein n=1 Tax=Piscinibacter sp. XHJ-5 TaxID=3037797 RepID=UPI0024536097|nr:hypothetical protein [Piscinibacter sp. XHJ-5]